jgi:hypothetical protein
MRDALHHQAPLFGLHVGNPHLKFIPVGLARFGLTALIAASTPPARRRLITVSAN